MKKLIILFATALFCITTFAQKSNQPVSPHLFKLIEAVSKIQKEYVEPINDEKMTEDAIIGILEELDPHSSYIPKKEVDKMNEPLVGNFEGIGVRFQMLDDTLFVDETIIGGPSEKVGILPGDRIITANDTLIAGVKMSSNDIMKRLRGKKGSVVTVKIIRRGYKGTLVFKITRDKIPLNSVDAYYMAKPGVGYIKLSKFSATSMDEFHKAFNELQAQGLQSLILDLQTNGGGYLRTATDLCTEFLDAKKLLVYTQGRQSRQNYEAGPEGSFRKGNLVILVNEYSASASEIVSGAIQDWDRGIIVGRRTFGKGLVQAPVFLSDGSMMRLTTARYYTPSGRCIQKPYENGNEEYRKDAIERYNRGELTNADSIHFPDSLKQSTLILHRTVYGGGGIMPDYFVPLDTTAKSDFLENLYAKGIMSSFPVKYLEKHKASFTSKYPTFASFKQDYHVTEIELNEIVAIAKEEGLKFTDEELKKATPFISTHFKALVARGLWGMNEFYQIFNEENDTYTKAVEILSTEGMYDTILKKKAPANK